MPRKLLCCTEACRFEEGSRLGLDGCRPEECVLPEPWPEMRRKRLAGPLVTSRKSLLILDVITHRGVGFMVSGQGSMGRVISVGLGGG